LAIPFTTYYSTRSALAAGENLLILWKPYMVCTKRAFLACSSVETHIDLWSEKGRYAALATYWNFHEIEGK
jgi:hypothetical protein